MHMHTNFVYLRKDADVMLDNMAPREEEAKQVEVELTLRKVYEFATETDIEELKFILDAKRMDETAAAAACARTTATRWARPCAARWARA